MLDSEEVVSYVMGFLVLALACLLVAALVLRAVA